MEFGANENDVVRLSNGNNSAAIHLYGATLLSWKSGEKEHIFVSKCAVFDNKKAIRGGIPFVFPNFGPWSLGPQHGFARISMWSLIDKTNSKAVFRLTETQESLNMWPFKFEVTYTVELAENALNLSVSVQNKDDKDWDFTLLLHTYFNVDNIANVRVDCLDKCTYVDKLDNAATKIQNGPLAITRSVDSVYQCTGDVVLTDGGYRYEVIKQGLPDTVVWNPWKEGSESMGDMNDDAYLNMICIEPGKVSDRVVLKAKEIYNARTVIKASKL